MTPTTRAIPERMIATRPRTLRLLTSSSTISDSDSRGEEDDFGVAITIENGRLQLQLCCDENFINVHPHVYGPKMLRDVHPLGGGGSGVAVFTGIHPVLGDIVMKHGGNKDLKESFALATIDEDLRRRGVLTKNPDAALDMQRRTPEFKMLYISPFHIVEKAKDLTGHIQHIIKNWDVSGINPMDVHAHAHPHANGYDGGASPSHLLSPRPRRFAVKLDAEHCINGGMSIRLYEGEEEDDFTIVLDTESRCRSLAMILPKNKCEFLDERTVVIKADPYESLQTIVNELMPIMSDRLFKFTLAQRTIGGESPKRGNQWLYEGKLKGPILQNLITQFIQVIRHLQSLTLPEEVDVVEMIRDEVADFENGDYVSAAELSHTADAFVGNSIVKNFHPQKGRALFLREISKQFRENSLFLTPEEVIPAKHLGDLLCPGALMSDTFHNAPMEPTVLQPQQHFWRNILARAVDDRETMSPTALRRIWTCGMTDAGIHNLFVSESDLYLFDLGEPQLQSVPGFLTKFLFSFFHTLGMEEGEDKEWVRRFVPRGNKLALTEATVELLPKAYDAFEECFDRIINEVLDGDDEIRWLLLQYVTLQLLSDTAFCLQRWEIKGGGRPRDHNHQKGIERWLWRALWDVYVAYDINTPESWARLQVEHPHFQMPVFDGRYSVTGFEALKKRMSTGEQISDSLRKFLEEEEESNSRL